MGDYTNDIETFGDTVDASHTMHYTSCMEIAKYYKGAPEGPYYVVRMTNENRLERVLVNCIFSTDTTTGKSEGITYKRLSGAMRIEPYQATDGNCPEDFNGNCHGDCEAFGLKMLEKSELPDWAKNKLKTGSESSFYTVASDIQTDQYLCGVSGEKSMGPTGSMILVNGTDSSELLHKAIHDWHPKKTVCAGQATDCLNYAGEAQSSLDTVGYPDNTTTPVDGVDWTGMAHEGVYVITYRVKDSQGNYNDQCNAACDKAQHPRLAQANVSVELAHTGEGTAACCGRLSMYHIGWESRTVPHTQCGNN